MIQLRTVVRAIFVVCFSSVALAQSELNPTTQKERLTWDQSRSVYNHRLKPPQPLGSWESLSTVLYWSGRGGLNLRPPVPERISQVIAINGSRSIPSAW